MSHSNIFDQEDHDDSNDASLTEDDLINPEAGQHDQEIVEDFKNFSLTPKELMQMKLNAKKREEEENYTFQPKIKPSKWSIEQSERIPVGSRFDKLYTDALKRKKAIESMTPVDEKDLTFKPKISSSRSSSRDRGRPSSPSNIVERLYTAKGAGRVANVPSDVDKSTFQPTFATKRPTSAERNQGLESTERMYMAAKESKEKQEKRKADAEARLLKECSFSPKISTRPSSATRERPPEDIAHRLQRYEEQKIKRIEDAKKALEEKEAAEITFKPALKATKRSITPTQEKNVFERLAVSSERDLKYVQDELDAELTFKPNIVSKRSSSPADKGPVHERLFKEAERRRVSMDQEVRHREDEIRGQGFKPMIEGSYQLHDEERKSKPVFERLASSIDRQQMQNILTQVKNDLEMEECTFKPQIVTDAKMKFKASGDAATPVHVRLNSEAEYLREQARLRLARKTAEDLKGATFKPSLNAASQAIAGQRRNSKGFMDPLHDKRAEVKDDSLASPAVSGAKSASATSARKSFSAGGGSAAMAGGTGTTTPRSSNSDFAPAGETGNGRRPKTPLSAPKVYPPPASANGTSSSTASGKSAASKGGRPSTPTSMIPGPHQTQGAAASASKTRPAARPSTPSNVPVTEAPPPAAKSLRGQRKSGAPDTLNTIATAAMAEVQTNSGVGTDGAGAGAEKSDSPSNTRMMKIETEAADLPAAVVAAAVADEVATSPTVQSSPVNAKSAAEPIQTTSKTKSPTQPAVSDSTASVAPPGRKSPSYPLTDASVGIVALPAPPAKSPMASQPVVQPPFSSSTPATTAAAAPPDNVPMPPTKSPQASQPDVQPSTSAPLATSAASVPVPPTKSQQVSQPTVQPPQPPASSPAAPPASDGAPVGKVLRGRKKVSGSDDSGAAASALSGPGVSLLSGAGALSADGARGGVGAAGAVAAPSSSAVSVTLAAYDNGNSVGSLAPIEKAPVPVPVTAPVPLLSSTQSQSRPQTPTSTGRSQTPTSTRSHTPTLPMSSPVPDGERPPANKVLRGRKKSTTAADPSATIADAVVEAAAEVGAVAAVATASAVAQDDDIESF